MNGLIEFCQRRIWAVLATLVVVTVGAGALASNLSLDSNLQRLLPEGAPSVEGLRQLEKNYGGQIGRLTVVLEADGAKTSQAQRLEKIADRLAPRLGQVDDVRRVESKRPLKFFRTNRLLYAHLDDLKKADKRLEKRIRWEKKRANPLFVALDDGKPPAVDFSDLVDKYKRFDKSPYYVSDDGKRLAIFVYPSFPASDLARAQKLSARVSKVVHDTLAAELGGADGAPKIAVGLTGRYQKRIELQQRLQSDLSLATLVAVTLLVLFLLFFLRSVWAMLIVIVPLISGTIWALAWAEIAFGSLNILTGFLGAVLLGMGVDYGIHLYVRFHELRGRMSLEEALTQTFQSSGRANLYAGMTTAIALGSLMISDFRAFFEFGVIALGGIAVILLAYTLWMTCLLLLASRYLGELAEPVSQRWTRRLAQGARAASAGPDVWRRVRRVCAVGFVAIVVVGLSGLGRVHFVRSLRPLEMRDSRAWHLDAMVNKMLGQSQTPTVVLTDNAAQSAAVVNEIERRKKQAPGGFTIDKALDLQSLLPKHQAAKRKLLARLRDQLEDVPKRSRSKKLTSYLDEIKTVLAAGPLGPQDLPVALREPFLRKGDGDAKPSLRANGGVVLVFPAIDLADFDKLDQFVGVLRDLPGIDAPGRYDAISEAMLLHDIVRLVERDAVWMLAITIAGLLLCSFAAFRRRREIAIQMGVLAAAFFAALGWAAWFGVELNFLNIVIMPIWLGLGIDATFHVLMHLRDEPGETAVHVATALAIAAAFITTMIGFGSMLLAHHNGLRSLGEIAVIGLGVILTINMLAQFWLVGGQHLEGTDGNAE